MLAEEETRDETPPASAELIVEVLLRAQRAQPPLALLREGLLVDLGVPLRRRGTEQSLYVGFGLWPVEALLILDRWRIRVAMQ